MSRQRKKHPRAVWLSKRRQRMITRVTKKHLYTGSKLYKYRLRTIERLQQAEDFRAIDEFFAKLNQI